MGKNSLENHLSILKNMGDIDALEDYLSSVSTQGLAIPYNLTDDYIVILIGVLSKCSVFHEQNKVRFYTATKDEYKTLIKLRVMLNIGSVFPVNQWDIVIKKTGDVNAGYKALVRVLEDSQHWDNQGFIKQLGNVGLVYVTESEFSKLRVGLEEVLDDLNNKYSIHEIGYDNSRNYTIDYKWYGHEMCLVTILEYFEEDEVTGVQLRFRLGDDK